MKTFKKARESRISITELMLPTHSNFGGKVHGGHIPNLMDQIAFAFASKTFKALVCHRLGEPCRFSTSH